MASGAETAVARDSLYKELLYSEAEVNARIAEMAAEVVARYDPAATVFVSLMNGAQPFSSKLMFAIQEKDPYFHPNVQPMNISRYGLNREPGPVRLITDLPPTYRNLSGRKVVLLDDLVDGGETLAYARQHVLAYGAEAVDSVVLVQKAQDPPIEGDIAMYGFNAPNVWLTGMGMDDERLRREGNRWAGWIAIANAE